MLSKLKPTLGCKADEEEEEEEEEDLCCDRRFLFTSIYYLWDSGTKDIPSKCLSTFIRKDCNINIFQKLFFITS